MISCPHCQTSTPDELKFCRHCKNQTKCLNKDCGQLLISDETFCFHCGESVKENHRQTQLNKFVHDVKQQGKNLEEHTEFIFSDDVAREIAPFVGGQFLGGSPQRSVTPPKHNNTFVPLVPKALTQNAPGQETGEISQAEPVIEPLLDNAPTRVNTRFFRRDGDVLLAETKDYKGTNWAKQQRYFILLYAAAYEELFGKPVPEKDHFKSVAEKANIIDRSNFTKYLSEEIKKHFLETSNGLALNNDGKLEVQRIIADIDNPKITEGEAYWNKSQTDTTKRIRLSDKDKQRLQDWAKEDIDVGQLDPLLLKSGLDYALFAFWSLITHLKKGEGFPWNEAFEYLKARPIAVSASPETFSRAVKSDSNKEYFRADGEAYFLTPEANTKVESWIAGNSKPSGPDKKTAS